MSNDQLAAEIAAKLHEHREVARRRSDASAARAAAYAKALADTLVSYDAADPGEPATRDDPGSPASPAVVYLQDDELVGFSGDQFYETTLCQTFELERMVHFDEQGHNHSEEVPCADTYRQWRVDAATGNFGAPTLREFDPLAYPPGQAPQQNVIEPCPAVYTEPHEVVVTGDDVARRLAACWNALRGIPTEALEKYSESIAIIMDAWIDCKLYRERIESLAAKTEPAVSPASRP